ERLGTGLEPLDLDRLDVGEQHGRARLCRPRAARLALDRLLRRLLHERVPLAAAWAAAHPARRDMATGSAGEVREWSRHRLARPLLGTHNLKRRGRRGYAPGHGARAAQIWHPSR